MNLALQLVQSGSKTHVHELRLGVHLEAALNGWVKSELKFELLAFVVGVGLQGREDLVLLTLAQWLGRDDSNLLLLVEQGIEFLISVRDATDE